MAPIGLIIRMFSPMNIFTCLLLLHVVLGSAKSNVPYRKIYVDQVSQNGNFKTIQSAIDSVPSSNPNWIVIHIKQGTYSEKVTIPSDKPFIVLKGKGKKSTEVVWDDHERLNESATFTCFADNVVIKGISFRNSYNNPVNGRKITPAAAATVLGDKVYFYKVGFFGVQDTLWDARGRHYFRKCTIQGAMDFIFGDGQSIYEDCSISVYGEALGAGHLAYITAQGRERPDNPSGFVFKNCNVFGSGSANAILGRPWRAYARVLFYHCNFADVVEPKGWDAWSSAGREDLLTFGEYECHGPGANTTDRVSWERNFSWLEVKQLSSTSFINSADWLYTPPFQGF